MNIPLGVYQIINFVNAVLSLLIGLFVLFTKRISKQTILFVVFAFLVFLWDFFFFLAFQTTNYFLSRFLFRTCMIAGTLILPVFTEFVYALVGKRIRIAYRIVNFSIAGSIIATIYTNLYALDGGPFLVFDYWPIIGVMSFLQILHYGLNIFFSHGALLRASIDGDSHLKQQAKIVMIGTSLGYLGAAANFLLWFRIPFPPILNMLIPIYVFSVAYAITKTRLMDIGVVISRAAAEILTITFLGSLYLGLVWLYRSFVATQIDFVFLLLTVIFGILVGQIYQRIRNFIQTPTDKLFVKPSYDRTEVLSQLISGLTKSLTHENIAKVIFDVFSEGIDVFDVSLYFLDKKKPLYNQWDPKTALPLNNSLPSNDPLIQQLLSKKGIVLFDKKIAVPCLADDQLIAIITMGKKRNEDDYNNKDFKLFKTIGDYVGVTLKHVVKPYEKMTTDLSLEKDKVAIAQRELEKSHRLTALSQLAAGVMHEVRNPMSIIRSNAELIAEKLDDKKYLKWVSGVIVDQIDRALSIITRTLKLAKAREEEDFSLINISQLLEETLAPMAGEINSKYIQMEKHLANELLIQGRKENLSEALTNIILNAIAAMDARGVLTISAEKQNGNIIIKIKDTGCGIPEDKLGYIFNPFFTTKDEGTGLGLSIAYRIIKEHNGNIEVESKAGKGTTFFVTLPV